MFTADVKSTFLQSDDLETCDVEIYGRPTNDVRRRLERLMGLQPREILKFKKAGFGNMCAPQHDGVWCRAASA